MARRKKGLPIDGWLVIDKPEGVGSTAVVSKARWALRAQKAGHSGTLDPLATGVLAVAFGEATKTVPYAQDGEKRYRFTVQWGVTTRTDDREGEVSRTSEARPEPSDIEAATTRFRGVVQQRPPAFSAVKLDGARAYDRARAGENLELAPRPIRIDALTLVATPDANHAIFDMTCGKGGYVRSVARDLGEALGCGGHVTALRRLKAGPFDMAQAISFEMLEDMRNTEASDLQLLPIAAGLDDIPALTVNREAAAALRLGRAAAAIGAVSGREISYGDVVWAAWQGAPVAIGVYKGGLVHPSRVFAEPAKRPVVSAQ